MVSESHLEEIRKAFREDEGYLSLCSTPMRALLLEMIDHPYFPGVTDPGALGLIGQLMRLIQPRRVLQLGTHVGFSAVYFADLLARNLRPGQLVTVDPAPLAHEEARRWAVKAGLEETIVFLDGFSTDEEIGNTLRKLGPFDLIYLDSSHRYAETLYELGQICAPGGWLSTDGILLLHDVTEFSADLASDLDGGVRRAFLEWSETHRDRYHDLILEPPLWPNLCGLGIVVRRTARPVAEVSQEVVQVYQAVLAAKEAKIAQLEARLQRLESNWLLRRLYGGQNAR